MATTTESENQTNLGEKVSDVSENLRKVVQNLLPQILKGYAAQLNGSGVNQLRDGMGWETGTFVQQFRERFHQIGRRVSSITLPESVNGWIQSGKAYAKEHPMTAFVVIALAITCALPVVAFLSFALITLLVTFTGFLFVEGTILGVAAMVLGGALLIVGGITLSFVSFLLVSYYVATKIYTKLTGDPAPHKYLTRLPYIGHLFANIDHSGSNGDAPKIPNGYEEGSTSEEGSLAQTD